MWNSRDVSLDLFHVRKGGVRVGYLSLHTFQGQPPHVPKWCRASLPSHRRGRHLGVAKNLATSASSSSSPDFPPLSRFPASSLVPVVRLVLHLRVSQRDRRVV